MRAAEVLDDRRRMDQVAERLAELRERRALTLRELGAMSGVAADTINQIELGHRKARPSTLRKLARALEMDVQEFYAEPALGKGEAPKEAGHSTDNAQLNATLEDLRHAVDLYEHLRMIEKAVDEYREVWEKRLAEGEFEKTAVEEAGHAIGAFWPAVTTAADAEMSVLQGQLGLQPEEAEAQSVLLPAMARFRALGDKVNSMYRAKFGNNVYAFPQRKAS
jgi:transcriptional regulator with XRE-family HTH domain